MHLHKLIPLLAVILTGISVQASDSPFPWQLDYAKVTETGDIEWTPEPFRFEAGDNVRYIDFENGDDANDGLTKATAWKRHPWDFHATGQAAAHEGVTTYIFRRGVVYRGNFEADESGEVGNPIILTASSLDKSSPHYWGEGEAMLFGSARIPSNWVKATEVDFPERIPSPGSVWAIDIKDVVPMELKDGEYRPSLNHPGSDRLGDVNMPFIGFVRLDDQNKSHWQHLARSPNWEPGNPNYVLDYWHVMDDKAALLEENAKKPYASGFKDEEVLKGHPDDWFEGGYIWQQYAHFMGTPTPKLIKYEDTNKKGDKSFKVYDPEKGALYTGNLYGATKGGVNYMLENLPQFLDAPEEYYFDAKSGVLFYIPPQGMNPNQMKLEWTTHRGGMQISNQSNILINGLSLRHYDWNGIRLREDVENVTVSNCQFEHLVGDGLLYEPSGTYFGEPGNYATNIVVKDNLFSNVSSLSLYMGASPHYNRILGHVEILRNYIDNNGMRHQDNVQSQVEALRVNFPRTGIIAGNIVNRSFGSGIIVFTGAHQEYRYTDKIDSHVAHFPLTRVHIMQNKTVDTALGVNDYGGFSLWQGGVQYCYNNNIGNSPGVMPAGIAWFNTPPRNLSYPLYLDGAYKIYSFNNVVWARSNNADKDKYATSTPGYFMVFGFLNQLSNNTFYRTGQGVGGSAGHRNDVIANLFSEVGATENGKLKRGAGFIANDRTGDPSLVGGGDTGDSGRRGVPTLAFANNVFHGPAKAGRLLKPGRFGPESPGIEADTIEALAEDMMEFPIRYGQLGWKAEQNPIIGKSDDAPINDISEVDFRLSQGSMAIDKGATYFVPWSLYGTVGEWHFTENHADPRAVIDYAWYMAEPHYHRMMYEFVPSADLLLNEATLEDYGPSPSEDWVNGSMVFDGTRYATVADEHLRADIVIEAYPKSPDGEYGKQRAVPVGPDWQTPEPVKGEGRKAVFEKGDQFTFPGELRRTLAISTENILMEANLKTQSSAGVIMGKHDGKSGYQLAIKDGKPVFTISSDGKDSQVSADQSVNNNNWHHVLAEVDRESGRMTIYIDGKKAGESKAPLAADASVDNGADFLVAKGSDDSGAFVGQIDYARVCHGTLADAETTIEELYAWQTEGPWKYDMLGNPVAGDRRDAGAIERVR